MIRLINVALLVCIGFGLGGIGTGVGLIVSQQRAPITTVSLLPSDELIFNSTVKVIAVGGHGTGTLGLFRRVPVVLTAAHVVDRGPIRVVYGSGQATIDLPIGEVTYDDDLDLAIITLRWVPPGPLADLSPVAELTVGEPAMYVGYAKRREKTLERSLISGLCVPEWLGVGPRFSVNGNGYYGSSGSSIWVYRCGLPRLAGVLAQIDPNDVRSPLYCVTPETLRRFLEDKVPH